MQKAITEITVVIDKYCGCTVALLGGTDLDLVNVTWSGGLYLVHRYIVALGRDLEESDKYVRQFFPLRPSCNGSIQASCELGCLSSE